MNRIILTLILMLQMHSLLAAEFDHSDWDALLKQHVVSIRDGHATQVDYAAFSKHRTRLKSYLATTSAVARNGFDRWPKAEQLTFLINVYNAWTIELVLTGYPDIESIKDLGSLFSSPWSKAFIPLFGETKTLDDIEHGLIRGSGRYNEPRIHFAVNCASIGCPALRAEAYVANRLEAQLENATRRFLSDPKRNYLQGDSLMLSKIFDWYGDDFAKGWRGLNSLGEFLAHYRRSLRLDLGQAARLKNNSMEIEFLDYNWRLNSL